MLISVVTPVYNGENFVQSAYDCLCRQTYPDWEWVVVDDGSTDGTARRLETLASGDERIRFFQQKNSGTAKQPRDHAVYEAKGGFVLPLDIDDQLSDDYLERMAERQQQTDADIIYPQMLFVDLDSGKTTQTLPAEGFDTDKVYEARELVKETVPEWRIGCNGGLYRKSAWINMSYPEKKEPIWMNSDEVDERLYLIHAGKAAFAKARYYYQNHEASTTTRISPKVFHTQKTALQLLDIMEREFGKDSEEYRRTMRRTFCDWRWKMMLFVKHHEELTDADAEIQRNLSDCFKRLDASVLTKAERIQFLNLRSFPLVLALYCLRYNRALLREKVMQRRNPEGFANTYTRKREEEKVRRETARSYLQGKTLNSYEPYVISMFCGNTASGGLVDRLRGAVSLYAACKVANRPFRLFFTHPFQLTDYLIPNEYDWRINADEVSFAPSQTQPVILDTQTDTAWERSWQREQFAKALQEGNDIQLHFYSNAQFCYDDDFSGLFNELFKPSDQLQESINHILKQIGGPYLTISARFCNLLNDFNEETYSDPLSKAEQEQLIAACLSQVKLIHQQNSHLPIIICSDSITFTSEAQSLDYVKIIPGNVSHIGNDTVRYYQYYEKTFLDFYIISQAQQVFLLRGNAMHNSGFPYAAARVGKRPYSIVEF